MFQESISRTNLVRIIMMFSFVLIPFQKNHADLPPDQFEKLLSSAKEVLNIIITDVTKNESTSDEDKVDLSIEAVIHSVERSESGFKAGQVVKFKSYYVVPEAYQRGFVGPVSPPEEATHAGWSGRIYLNDEFTPGTLHPAAYGRSFEPKLLTTTVSPQANSNSNQDEIKTEKVTGGFSEALNARESQQYKAEFDEEVAEDKISRKIYSSVMKRKLQYEPRKRPLTADEFSSLNLRFDPKKGDHQELYRYRDGIIFQKYQGLKSSEFIYNKRPTSQDSKRRELIQCVSDFCWEFPSEDLAKKFFAEKKTATKAKNTEDPDVPRFGDNSFVYLITSGIIANTDVIPEFGLLTDNIKRDLIFGQLTFVYLFSYGPIVREVRVTMNLDGCRRSIWGYFTPIIYPLVAWLNVTEMFEGTKLLVTNPVNPNPVEADRVLTTDDLFRYLFLKKEDLPNGFTFDKDFRITSPNPNDVAFKDFDGVRAGYMKWAPNPFLSKLEPNLIDFNKKVFNVTDIRMQFPSEDAAKQYISRSLDFLSEGADVCNIATKVGSDCHVFGPRNSRVKLKDVVGFDMNAYIYVFRSGTFVAKIFVVLIPLKNEENPTPDIALPFAKRANEYMVSVRKQMEK